MRIYLCPWEGSYCGQIVSLWWGLKLFPCTLNWSFIIFSSFLRNFFVHFSLWAKLSCHRYRTVFWAANLTLRYPSPPLWNLHHSVFCVVCLQVVPFLSIVDIQCSRCWKNLCGGFDFLFCRGCRTKVPKRRSFSYLSWPIFRTYYIRFKKWLRWCWENRLILWTRKVKMCRHFRIFPVPSDRWSRQKFAGFSWEMLSIINNRVIIIENHFS